MDLGGIGFLYFCVCLSRALCRCIGSVAWKIVCAWNDRSSFPEIESDKEEKGLVLFKYLSAMHSSQHIYNASISSYRNFIFTCS